MENVQDSIKLLKKAHSRLNEDYKTLMNKHIKLNELHTNLCNYVEEELLFLYQEIGNLKSTQPSKVKTPFVIGNNYMERVSEIIETKDVDWNNGKWIKYELKLIDRDELYNAFVQVNNEIRPGYNIRFNYGGEGKLKSIKVI